MNHSESAHAALIVDDVVEAVIVIPYCNDDDHEVTSYCNSLGLEGTWIDCSYNAKRRGHYPSRGFRFDKATDQFIPPHYEFREGEWKPPIDEPYDV